MDEPLPPYRPAAHRFEIVTQEGPARVRRIGGSAWVVELNDGSSDVQVSDRMVAGLTDPRVRTAIEEVVEYERRQDAPHELVKDIPEG